MMTPLDERMPPYVAQTWSPFKAVSTTWLDENAYDVNVGASGLMQSVDASVTGPSIVATPLPEIVPTRKQGVDEPVVATCSENAIAAWNGASVGSALTKGANSAATSATQRSWNRCSKG